MRTQAISQSLLSLIDARRDELAQAEKRGHFDPAFIVEISRTGFFDLTKPRCYGGEEIDYETLLGIVVNIARRSGSLAWCLMIMAQHNIIVRRGARPLLDELFRSDPLMLASSFFPPGHAVPRGSSYVLSGTWKYVTGIHWANWVMVDAYVEGESRSAPGKFIVPARHFRVDDDWHVVGMAASGSNSASLAGVEVPERYRVDRPLAEGEDTLPKPEYYRMPQNVMTSLGTTAPLVGMLSAMARDAMASFAPRKNESSISEIAQRDHFLRIRNGIEEVESQFRLVSRAVVRIAREQGVFSRETQYSVIARCSSLADRCRALSSELYAWYGTKAAFSSHSAARRLADIHVMSTHYLVRPAITHIEHALATLNR